MQLGDVVLSITKGMIDFVSNLDLEIRAEIIYRHLVLNESTRLIEKEVLNTSNSGWNSWNVQQVYGFNKKTKGIMKNEINNLNFKNQILDSIKKIDISNLDKELGKVTIDDLDNDNEIFSENDGKDILRIAKDRVGQAKWRNKLLKIYDSQCALCDISHPALLIASHIKSWQYSNEKERIDTDNGIIFCALHDRLFDRGFISFSDNYEVLYSKNYNFESIGLEKDLKFRKKFNKSSNKSYFLSEHRKIFKFNT